MVNGLTLDFEPATHTYTVDGKAVPSVTQIVAPLGQDYDEPDEMTEIAIDYAAERGTIMHEYIAHRLGGGEPDVFEIPDEYADYADGVEQFLAEHSVVPFAVETPITNAPMVGLEEYYVAGTPDLVCEFDGRLAILDYKFVSSVAKSKVCAQLGGYLKLCECNAVYPEALYAVQFKRGDYRLYPVNEADAVRMWNAALNLYYEKTFKHARGRIGK